MQFCTEHVYYMAEIDSLLMELIKLLHAGEGTIFAVVYARFLHCVSAKVGVRVVDDHRGGPWPVSSRDYLSNKEFSSSGCQSLREQHRHTWKLLSIHNVIRYETCKRITTSNPLWHSRPNGATSRQTLRQHVNTGASMHMNAAKLTQRCFHCDRKDLVG